MMLRQTELSNRAVSQKTQQGSGRRRIIAACALLFCLAPAALAAPPVVTNYDSSDDLDFSGTFAYALDIGGNDGPLTVNGLTFLDDDTPPVPGVTASGDNNNFAYQNPNYTGADDVALEALSNSIRWDLNGSGLDAVNVDLAVTAGKKYKLQLFWQDDASGNRGTDIFLDGTLLLDDLAQSTGSTNLGKLVTYEFIAPDSMLNIELDGTDTTGFSDQNAILSGLTLELVPEPASLTIWSLIGVVLVGFGYYRLRRKGA